MLTWASAQITVKVGIIAEVFQIYSRGGGVLGCIVEKLVEWAKWIIFWDEYGCLIQIARLTQLVE